MKTLLLAAAALSVLGATAASAQPHHYGRSDHGRRDYGRSAHNGYNHARWARGQHLPRNYWGRGYYVNDWRARHLRAPPRGYAWRRVDNNYVLAAVATGLIASVIAANQ